MTWAKICGTTNLQDALLAVEAGADAVGFVFGPSKRRVTAEVVAPIIRELPGEVEKIGVFLNETPEGIAAIAEHAGLTGVQLHGNESQETARKVAGLTKLKIIKGVHAGPALASDLVNWSQERCVNALLLDSGNGQQGGGTGKTFDWEDALAALANLNGHARFIVAGGLTSANVAAAIQKFRPWGVDVASGVEVSPGKKDPQKLKAFVAAVRNAGSER